MVYLLKEASAEVTANLHIHKEVVEDPATRNTFFKLKYHSSKSNSDVINDAAATCLPVYMNDPLFSLLFT